MNYLREFAGKEPLPAQDILKELYNPYTQEKLPASALRVYNMYTEDFNNSRYRASQEFYLDQRAKFFHSLINTI